MAELPDKAEEILEHMWIRAEEGNAPPDLGIFPSDVIELLERKKLIDTRGNRVELTEDGRRNARGCVRRHRLAERLLADVLDSADEELHAAGCKFEHGLHHGLEEKVCAALGHPRVCPHGKPIPPGECCRRLESEPGPMLARLSDMKAGEEGVIAYLHSKEQDDLRKLMAMGALPRVGVVLEQRFPSFLIKLGNSRFAVDAEMAGQIYVRRTNR
jgi:DtxR family Mn-dependent transcriptional regulator